MIAAPCAHRYDTRKYEQLLSGKLLLNLFDSLWEEYNY